MLLILLYCRYHEWMKSPELQHLTGSEPLTIDEEYQMQKSWQEDENSIINNLFYHFNGKYVHIVIYKIYYSRVYIYYSGS